METSRDCQIKKRHSHGAEYMRNFPPSQSAEQKSSQRSDNGSYYWHDNRNVPEPGGSPLHTGRRERRQKRKSYGQHRFNVQKLKLPFKKLFSTILPRNETRWAVTSFLGRCKFAVRGKIYPEVIL